MPLVLTPPSLFYPTEQRIVWCNHSIGANARWLREFLIPLNSIGGRALQPGPYAVTWCLLYAYSVCGEQTFSRPHCRAWGVFVGVEGHVEGIDGVGDKSACDPQTIVAGAVAESPNPLYEVPAATQNSLARSQTLARKRWQTWAAHFGVPMPSAVPRRESAYAQGLPA